MRIISQEGRLDLPYEKTVLEKAKNKIIAYSLSTLNDADYLIMAVYSTEEKATKAIEMCREKYLSRMELNGGYDVINGCYVQPNYWVLPKVFQFPKGEEVQI